MKKKKVLEIYNDVEKLKVYYPEAFEKGLEYGRWIKDDSNPMWLTFQINESKKYGFNGVGDWFEKDTEYDATKDTSNRYATHQEIATALINEAKKRGYKTSITCKFGLAKDIRTIIFDVFNYSKEDGSLSLGQDIIFINGKWAEIVTPKMTKEQIEKELGYNIEIVWVVFKK